LIRPHLGSSRKIQLDQKIHSSLTLSNNINYTPKARPLDDNRNFWENARKNGLGDWLERDLYEYTLTLVEKLISERPGTALQPLRQTARWSTSAEFFIFSPWFTLHPPLANGLQAVYDGVIKVLERNNLEPEDKLKLLQAAVDIVGSHARESTSLKLGDYMEIYALVSDVWDTNRKLAQNFLTQFTNCEQKNLYCH